MAATAPASETTQEAAAPVPDAGAEIGRAHV